MLHPNLKLIALTFFIILLTNSCESTKLTTNKTFALSDTPDCTSQTFNNCMNCLIIKTCGSDWMCMVACSIEIYACVAGAAALCIVG